MVAGLILAAFVLAPQGPPTVPDAITKKLTTGLNITRWFCYTNASDTNHFKTYWTPMDFKNLDRIGARFVRLCVSPEVIYDNGKLNSTNLPFLDTAVKNLSDHKLVVLLDLHDNGQLKLDVDDHDNIGFVKFWENMAKHFKGVAEDSVVFELLNEPVFQKNPEVWYALQQQTVDVVRAVDPQRTLMVTSTSWSSIDTLAEMKPLSDRNLLYTFHCYDPFLFTHQGASWVGDVPKVFKNMPFPSSEEAVGKMIADIPAQYRNVVEDYGKQHYDDAYLRSRIAKAMNWARQNNVVAVLGEFGAYPPVSPPDSRARWFAGMREAFKAERVPNCLWGYDDALGLGREVKSDGSIWLDPVVLKNLYAK